MELFPSMDMYGSLALFMRECYPDLKLQESDDISINKTHPRYFLANIHHVGGKTTTVKVDFVDFHWWCLSNILFTKK